METLEQELNESPTLDNNRPGQLARDYSRPELGDAFDEQLQASVGSACDTLISLQAEAGYWCFELEADCTISAEYILMMHFMDEIDQGLQSKIAVYLRARQDKAHGGWPLYSGGDFDISCSVKAYYALRFAGDSIDAPHMVSAREAILEHGGAARSNVFTRILLAMFGQLPWRGVPFIPVEMMFLPRWFPFHLNKISYWSRAVMVPLSILSSLKAKAENPNGVGIAELFTVSPDKEKNYFPVRSRLNWLFLKLERSARLFEPMIPGWIRQRAFKKAENWVIERLNGDNGLGGIFPAMVNAHEAFALLGYAADHPYRVATKRALEKLLVVNAESAYCQPCVSPVWDSCLASLALQEVDGEQANAAVRRSLDWLRERQLLDQPGDWQAVRPNIKGGGWPFQFVNDQYPDLDDTAAVSWAMQLVDAEDYKFAVQRAVDWIAGMQSSNGGFAAFDADNTYRYLDEIPFADHGALRDPPTSDVSARCLVVLSMLNSENKFDATIRRCLGYLQMEQESFGGWFGRWGTNYIYGTWSVLSALEQCGESPDAPYIQKAVDWLKSIQRRDGGWGESNDTYLYPQTAGTAKDSTTFQTALAMLALMAAGEVQSMSVGRGAEYLLRTQLPDGTWHDPGFNAPGFPRVFYLKYHGYDRYFPLWALARYYNLWNQNRD